MASSPDEVFFEHPVYYAFSTAWPALEDISDSRMASLFEGLTFMSKMNVSFSVAVLMLSVWAAAVPAQSDAAGYHVTICHRTGSATNPYVVISPDVEGVVNGHLDHEQTGNGLGGDIIPVFVYHGVTYSKNLGINIGGVSGAEILAKASRKPRL